MKYKVLCFALMLGFLPVTADAAKAKKEKKSKKAKIEVADQQLSQKAMAKPDVKEVEVAPVITDECIMNVSLFNESAKNKQFEDAFGPWLTVFNECPNANKAIYSQGAKILEWKFNNAATQAEKEEIRTLAMKMYDQQIKYFGDDPKKPTAWILGQKGVDYCEYFSDDPLKETAYGWLKESVNQMGNETPITVLVRFIEVSNGLYKSNPSQYAEQYINDYSLAVAALQVQAENPANKNAAAAAQYKEYLDNIFVVSGAASCDKLDELYAAVVKSNINNLDEMLKVVKMYKRVNCTESDIYFAAAESAHKMQPSEESAVGCAKMCYKKDDYAGAIEYYKEAISLMTADADKQDLADYQYLIALIYYSNLHRYSDARTYARLSLETKPNQGRCYNLIGLCYASSNPYSNSDYPAAKAAILNKTVYWAAVDKFQEAKRVDPSVAAESDKFIATYSKYFPTKEDMFDLPNELGGSTFTVGGWINERTTCRAAK